MLLTGLISFLQITLLPGFIVVSTLKIKCATVIQKWLYVFSFSLIINYSLVTIITLAGIYTSSAMWGIIIIELSILILFCRSEVSNLFSGFNFRNLYIKIIQLLKNNNAADRIIIIISGIIVLFYFSVLLANIGTIFYFVDTVNNYEWNNWAIDFANNTLPKYSAHFPQLLPANWSISYVLIGMSDVHFFPKAIMPLFFISNLLIFADLAYIKKSKIFLVGLIIYGLFAPIIYSLVFIADGNADLPVSFFAFITFYAFIKNEDINLKLKDYLLIFLFASAAAATKLAGLYTFTVASTFLGILLLTKRKDFQSRDIAKLLLFAICIGALALFWHIKAPDIMISGLNQPQYLSSEGYETIFMNALRLMYNNFGLPVFAIFGITIIASLWKKPEGLNKFIIPVRYITFIMVIIPTTIWMFKHSHDLRNLSFIVPFLSFISAVGLTTIISYLDKKKSDFSLATDYNYLPLLINKKNILYLLVFSILAGILLFISLSDTFYLFLLNIYESIYKYYFLSNRIIFFTEYGFLLHVDFYQRVFIVLSSILFVVPILILLKPPLKVLFAVVVIGVTILNFTLVNEDNILKHQEESFEKVDARNYYQWIRMFVENKGLKREVHTNFKTILFDKVARDIDFNFIEEVTKVSLKEMFGENDLILLKVNILNKEMKAFISSKFKSEEYKLLYVDRDLTYAFFIINPS